MIDIIHRDTKTSLYRSESAETINVALTRAVKAHANLRGADLSGAYLIGADLSGADLDGANGAEGWVRTK